MNKITCIILTNRKIENRDVGALFFNTLINNVPELTPDVYGNWEPIKQKFDINNLDTVLNNWNTTPFLWKKKSPKSEGSIWFSTPAQNNHNGICIDIESKKIDIEKLLIFYDKICTLLRPDFACITGITGNEIEKGKKSSVIRTQDKKQTKFTFSIFTPRLKKYIPDLYWLTVFGENYINFFGRDKLRSCPVYNVKELENGCIMLQLSENIQDLDNNVNLIEDTREKAKKHLKKKAFFEEAKGIDGKYETPWN